MTFTFPCDKCNHINTENDIEYRTTTCGGDCGCEGYEFELICSNCSNEIYSGSEWGEFDRVEVAKEIKEVSVSREESKDFVVIKWGATDGFLL